MTRKTVLALVAVFVVFSPRFSKASEVPPGIYILLDTSGSMIWTVTGRCDYSNSSNDYPNCAFGDGSVEHPHYVDRDGRERLSRIYLAKNAIATIIKSYPEVRWGFARFHQTVAKYILCGCTFQDDVSPAEKSDGASCTDWYAPTTVDLPDATDNVCYHYSGVCNNGNGNDSADILVPLEDNAYDDIIKWIDHHEYDPPSAAGGNGTDPEIRAYGGTPIGESLQTIREQLLSDIANDPRRKCRPYSVILLTDGDETCGGDPEQAARDLQWIPVSGDSCTRDSDCGTGNRCNGGTCEYHVRTYVIAFALTDTSEADAIAAAGDTGAAIVANSEEGLVSAMAGIIAASIKPEYCNGLDDDCDGLVDEDFTELGQQCDNGELGDCYHTGVYVCTADGLGVECNAPAGTPGQEVCDGRDNDCDGAIDEGLQCDLRDLCDGVDDDSDGVDGEDDPGVGRACGTNVGICESGVTKCVGGQIECCEPGGDPNTCIPVQGPLTEECNGEDDNCNGNVDEGLFRQCYPSGVQGCTCDAQGNCNCTGECSPGVSQCQNGSWGSCFGAITPVAETCDGRDNDCDGLTDENLTQWCYTGPAGTVGIGICRAGVQTCTNGSWGQCVGEVLPSTEVCDGTDNDCDGLVDEGLTQPCYTGPAGTEGVGICHAGASICQNGEMTEECIGEQTPREEECNGLDDDCDGLTDEGEDGSPLTRECYSGPPETIGVGDCRAGHQVCEGNYWGICEGEVTPEPEICDGHDNDCDGVVDDGTDLCRPNEVCYAADCRPKCDPSSEMACDPGEECIEVTLTDGTQEYICYPEIAPCGDNYCADDEVCRDGTCVNPCDPNPCEEWEECRVNRLAHQIGHENDPEYWCVDVSCTSPDHPCEDGEFCREHECLPDPCATTECASPLEYCERDCTEDGSEITCEGQCRKIPYCNKGERWDVERQECVTDPCQGVDCDWGKVCRDGQCIDDPCASSSCDFGQRCVAGHCVSDPCQDLDCPYFTHCTVDVFTGAAWCEPNEGVWKPGSEGDKVTTKGDGFGCSTSGGGGSFGWAALLPLLLVGMLRRRTNILKSIGIMVFFLAILSGCDTKSYTFRDKGELTVPAPPDEPDATCTPTNGGEEACDGIDNDCDGEVDEDFDLMTDRLNCGECGHVCTFFHAEARCVDGTCVMGECDPNWYDFNHDPSDGCETSCVPTNGGVERCDAVDNDCDGLTDEDFDLATDMENCGRCGFSCEENAPPHMRATGCVGGTCQYECEEGYLDLDGVQLTGCEYECTPTNGGVEECDGVDNDCDGQTDEDAQGNLLSRHCYTGPAGTEGVGICHGGEETCVGGDWNGVCFGEVTPKEEVCNGLDDDCDGQTDEDFDFDSDPLNCGGCGNVCVTHTPPNAVSTGCHQGQCTYVCLPGHYDLNGDIDDPNGDGCEYACTPTLPPGQEDCNGVDDDCDGQVDEPSDLVAPDLSLYCRTTGGCAGVTVSCTTFTDSQGNTTKTWVCNYPQGVERLPDSPNEVAYKETLCDGYDNDCDGQADEDFYPVVGTSCQDNDLGQCRGYGTYQCKSDKTGTECVITQKGSPSDEVCDGVDNDCDGAVDEGPWETRHTTANVQDYVVDDVDSITVDGHTVYVYTYEASKPTATATQVGFGTDVRACSRDGVLPWNRVTYTQAQEACARAGMRLCYPEEWYAACAGSAEYRYPYGNSYSSTRCNGEDNGAGSSVPAGSKTGCYNTSTGVSDTSGNLREWTMGYAGRLFDDTFQRVFILRGGSYEDGEEGLTCDIDTSGYPENGFDLFIGFRCCTTCGNGTVEPWEQCDDGNRVDGDGCDHLCARETGQTCGNGVREGSEECDDGNRIPGDGCSEACRYDCLTMSTDDYGYTLCEGRKTYHDIRSTGTKLDFGSYTDDGYTTVSLPFSFPYYGSSYTSITISINGLAWFGSWDTSNYSTYENTNLPAGGADRALFPWWRDLEIANSTQGVWVESGGTAPNRYFIVQWRVGVRNAGTSDPLDFEMILRENGTVEFRYRDVTNGVSDNDYGRDATVGLQGSSDIYDGYYVLYSYKGLHPLMEEMNLTITRP